MQMETPSIKPGTKINDRYLVKSTLGSGAMGVVYLVQDTLISQDDAPQYVALKLLNVNMCIDERYRKRFLREVQCTREVTHPNVVRTFEVDKFGDRLFFTMEYIRGVPLQERLKGLPLVSDLAVLIMIEILKGLLAIHQRGIIHRDLKPGNILVTSSGEVKIADFGVARPSSSSMTRVHEVVGSALYMAPEQWMGGEISDGSDIYALGVVAYEMLCGVVPFDGNTEAEVMCKHLEAVPVPPLQIASSVPGWLSTLVIRMLSKDPEERPDCESILKEVAQKFDPNTSSYSTVDLFNDKRANPSAVEEELPLYDEGADNGTAQSLDLEPPKVEKSQAPHLKIVPDPAPAVPGTVSHADTEDRHNLPMELVRKKKGFVATVAVGIGRCVIASGCFAVLVMVLGTALQALLLSPALVAGAGEVYQFFSSFALALLALGVLIGSPILVLVSPAVKIKHFVSIILLSSLYSVMLLLLATAVVFQQSGKSVADLQSGDRGARIVLFNSLKEGFSNSARAALLLPPRSPSATPLLESSGDLSSIGELNVPRLISLISFLLVLASLVNREVIHKGGFPLLFATTVALGVVPQALFLFGSDYAFRYFGPWFTHKIMLPTPVPVGSTLGELVGGISHYLLWITVGLSATLRRR